MIRESVRLIDAGVRPPQFAKPKAPPKPEAAIPDVLREALVANPAAQAHWDAFPPGARREYADWIGEAKQAATRDKRLTEAIGWIAEGKRRNWKYEKC